MKRLLAAAALTALLTTNAFAQMALAGNLRIGTNLIGGTSSEEEDRIRAGNIRLMSARLQLNLGDNDLGGRFFLFHRQNGANNSVNWTPEAFGFLWWRPIPQLWLQIGHNDDGNFGAQQAGGWGWNGDAQDYVAIDNDDLSGSAVSHARRLGFYPGYGRRGLLASISPIDNLTLNFVVPYRHEDGGQRGGNQWIPHAAQVYSKIHGGAVYNIQGIGTGRFSVIGGIGYWNGNNRVWDSNNDRYDPIKLYASFSSTQLVENVLLDFGVGYALPVTTDNSSAFGQEVTIFAPVQVGLGARYTAGDLRVWARLGTSFGGSIVPDTGDTVEYPFTLGFNILPSYNLGIFRAFFNAGIGFAAVSDYKKFGIETSRGINFIDGNGDSGSPYGANFNESNRITGHGGFTELAPGGFNAFGHNEENIVVSWYINPYIDKVIGQARVWAGFKLWSNGLKGLDGKNPDDIVVNWAVPIMMQYSF